VLVDRRRYIGPSAGHRHRGVVGSGDDEAAAVEVTRLVLPPFTALPALRRR
jgi:hypothetical protein